MIVTGRFDDCSGGGSGVGGTNGAGGIPGEEAVSDETEGIPNEPRSSMSGIPTRVDVDVASGVAVAALPFRRFHGHAERCLPSSIDPTPPGCGGGRTAPADPAAPSTSDGAELVSVSFPLTLLICT